MDKQLFVQNVKMYCQLRGIKPTAACRESGVGTSFINNIEARGQVPSVEKVQLLAQYLGVTTSQLLGEDGSTVPDPLPDLLVKYDALSPRDQEEVLAIIEMKLGRR